MFTRKKPTAWLLLPVVLLLLWVARGEARFDRGQMRFYSADDKNRYFDRNRVVTTTGVILQTISVPIPINKQVVAPGMGIVIQLPNRNRLAVHLGPFWFFMQKQIYFKPGDEVQVKGSIMVTPEGVEYMVAASITTGSQSLGLRDDFGVPHWQFLSGGLDQFNPDW